MPWYRKKLPRGSKSIIIQKRWFSFWFFGRHDFSATYSEMSTPINMAKVKCVEMERVITKLKADILNAEREYKVEVKSMEKRITGRDTDGGVVTPWKWERNPWWKFSLFQRAIPYVDEPLAYDSKTYSSKGSKYDRPRNKDMEVAVNVLGKEMDDFKEQVAEDAKNKVGKDGVLFHWEPGKDDVSQHEKNRRSKETDEKYKERMVKLEGKLVK